MRGRGHRRSRLRSDLVRRGLLPRFSRPLWLLQAGGLVNAVGDGLVLPFLVIYLHNVRGIGLTTAGLVIAVGAAATLITSPAVGVLADALDARLVLAAALATAAAGLASLSLIREAWQASVLIALIGAGEAGFRTGQSTLIASFATDPTRGAAFACNGSSATSASA